MEVQPGEEAIHVYHKNSGILHKGPNAGRQISQLGVHFEQALEHNMRKAALNLQRTALRGRIGLAFGGIGLAFGGIGLAFGGIGAYVWSTGGREVLEKHLESQNRRK